MTKTFFGSHFLVIDWLSDRGGNENSSHGDPERTVMSTWFITGAGRGFGAEIARTALAGGDNVETPSACSPSRWM